MVIFITLEGKEIMTSCFPYTFKKNNSKVYFSLNKKENQFYVEAIKPYSVKIMSEELVEMEKLSSLNRILIIKNNKDTELVHNYGGKINLKDDNVINTITFINVDNYQEAQENFLSGEKLINLKLKESHHTVKTYEPDDTFYPMIIQEPFYKNPCRISTATNININLWTFEERELLKKALLSFGYGRWEKIKLSFEKKQHLGLREKTVSEIRSYSNSLLKSISDNLNFQNFGLKHLLVYLLDQEKELPSEHVEGQENELNQQIKLNEDLKNDQHIVINSRDWDLNSIRQRAKPWAKRILIMYRINNFIQNYILFFEKKYQKKPIHIFQFSQLLNFINPTLLSGQKPVSWWTLLHDIHLLYSTYFNGYTNYLHSFVMKQFDLPLTWYFYPKSYLNKTRNNNDARKLFYMDKRIDFYSEIIVLSLPNADAITRRLKKMINIIFKISNETQKTTSQNESLSSLLSQISLQDKINFVEYVKVNGVPYNKDTQKFSFEDLRSNLNFSSEITIDQVQEFFNIINLVAFIVLSEKQDDSQVKEYVQEPEVLQIISLFSVESAEEFLRNNNFLYFWRHTFDLETIKKEFESYKQRIDVFLENKNTEKYDLNNFKLKLNIESYEKIFKHVQKNGFTNLKATSLELGFNEVYTMMNHLFLFFEYLKPQIEESNPSIQKKRKIEFQFYLKNKSKTKVQKKTAKISSSQTIYYPMHVSSSLKLLNIGQIINEPYYHTEHSIFPVGFKTIRNYYSIVYPGCKSDYICQIEKGVLKPIFKVMSVEIPEQPFVSEDPTDCWKTIYQKAAILNWKSVEKLTISGTERFGLLDNQVTKLIEVQSGVEKCNKYIRKHLKQFIILKWKERWVLEYNKMEKYNVTHFSKVFAKLSLKQYTSQLSTRIAFSKILKKYHYF